MGESGLDRINKMTRINSAAFCHSVKMAPVNMASRDTTMAGDLAGTLRSGFDGGGGGHGGH
jgi:hypothetical protein